MKSTEGDSGAAAGQCFIPLPHLLGCCPGKGNHKNIPRIDSVLLRQILDPMGDHRCFP